MYFVKLDPEKVSNLSWYIQSPKPKYVLYTECSRGKGRVWKEVNTNLWKWQVQFFVKSNGTKRLVYKSGACIRLADSARSVLKRLLSQRIDSLSKLLHMLANDQVMYELANLGNPKKGSELGF